MSQGLVNDIKTDAQFLGFKNDRRVIPLFYDFPCKNIKIIWNLRRCWLKKVIFVFIFFGLAFVEERFMRSKCTCFCFFKTVNCQTVTLVTQKKKFVFGNCQLSTVTLGDGVIDLSCDIIKIKLKKFGKYRYYSYICNVKNCNYC